MTATPPAPPSPAAAPALRPRLLSTQEGSSTAAFGATEWGLLGGIALIWGSSFLFMAIGLETLAPGVVTVARVGLGAAALALVPRARRPVDRADLPRVALLAVTWMALPLLLFPLAQQHIDSSLAGMINGSVPLFSALWATALLRRLPSRRQAAGLVLGFAGVVAIGWPAMAGAGATALGVGLVVLACVSYGLSTNLAVPLQQRYGALPVLLRTQAIALVVTLPFGLAGLGASTFAWSSFAAMLPLGLLGTGLAFVAMATLVGRAGGPRGAVAIYFIPVVALALGVLVRGEQVVGVQLLGLALVLAGAWLTSRRTA